MKLLKASKLTYTGVLALLMGCQTPTVYHAYQPVPRMGWSGHDTLLYTPLLPEGHYDMELSLRHHENYPYQNLSLALSYLTNDTVHLPNDTVAFILTDENGKWNGTGVSSLYQLSAPHKVSITVTEGDTLKMIQVRQIMRNTTLQGITDVGLRIEKRE
ncbi:MAG: gliding motility lipoprotein GldH [Phocaeicola sp.]